MAPLTDPDARTIARTVVSALAAGTAAAPSVAFTDDPDTGLFSSAANTLDVTCGGVRAAQFSTAASAVNYLDTAPAATGASPVIRAEGTDADIDFTLTPKGTGRVTVNADPTAALHVGTKQYIDATLGAVTRTELGADNTLTANTDTTIVSQALTMPASGGPWRVIAWWSVMVVEVGAATTWQLWVDDQQGATANIFADRQASFVGTSGGAGGGLSKQTYANSAAITLLLRVRSSGADTVKAAAAAGPAQIKTYLQTVVVRD